MAFYAQDISADDYDARVRLRSELIEIRKAQRISQENLSLQVGRTQSAFSQFARSTSWQIDTVQPYARKLHVQFVMRPIGLPDDMEPDDEKRVLLSMHPRTEMGRDELHFALIKNYLIRARIYLGMSLSYVGDAYGRSADSVQVWEQRGGGPSTMVYFVQRYARAIGGSLELELLKDREWRTDEIR